MKDKIDFCTKNLGWQFIAQFTTVYVSVIYATGEST